MKSFYYYPVPDFVQVEIEPLASVCEPVFVPVVLNLERAENALRNSNAPAVLCVEPPRSAYVTTIAEAQKFFAGD